MGSTIKISWSQFNKFPHNTFVWQGIDGSEVLTHFCPTDTYNGVLPPTELCTAQDKYAENDIVDEFLFVYGIGDGGGGPKDEFIERGLRMRNLEGDPKVKFDKAQHFFDRIEPHRNELEKWVGELYLELHRGSLTTPSINSTTSFQARASTKPIGTPRTRYLSGPIHRA